jgi:hypothetical protein
VIQTEASYTYEEIEALIIEWAEITPIVDGVCGVCYAFTENIMYDDTEVNHHEHCLILKSRELADRIRKVKGLQ